MLSHSEVMLDMFEKNKEITFLDLFMFKDNTIAKITAKTYDITLENEIDGIEVVFKSEVKRRQSTLDKVGITKEQMEAALDEHSGMRLISDYFINHNQIIAGCQVNSKIKRINKKMELYLLKMLNGTSFDVTKEAECCNVDINPLSDMRDIIKTCKRKYENLQKIEQNKFDCVVNYAYYKELEYGMIQKLVYCNTSLGLIFYNLNTDTWTMTKKEQKKTGRRIENFDIESIKMQLRKKYKVLNMSELAGKLKEVAV